MHLFVIILLPLSSRYKGIFLCFKYYFCLSPPLSDYMGYVMTIFLTWVVARDGVVELTGIEPATSSVQGIRSPKWATAPKIEKPISVLIPVYTNRPLLSSRWKITILLLLNPHHSHIDYQLYIHRDRKCNSHTYNFHYRILTQLPPLTQINKKWGEHSGLEGSENLLPALFKGFTHYVPETPSISIYHIINKKKSLWTNWLKCTIKIFGKNMDGFPVLNVMRFLKIWKNSLNIKIFISKKNRVTTKNNHLPYF